MASAISTSENSVMAAVRIPCESSDEINRNYCRLYYNRKIDSETTIIWPAIADHQQPETWVDWAESASSAFPKSMNIALLTPHTTEDKQLGSGGGEWPITDSHRADETPRARWTTTERQRNGALEEKNIYIPTAETVDLKVGQCSSSHA